MLEPSDECTLLASDFDTNLLGFVGAHPVKQLVDGLVHRLLLAVAVHPEPIAVGVVCPMRDHAVIRCLLGRGGKVSGDIEVEPTFIIFSKAFAQINFVTFAKACRKL